MRSRSQPRHATTCCISVGSPKAKASCRRSRSRAGLARRLILAAPENDYYRTAVAPHVDGTQITYAGEVGHAEKVALLGGARALLYPVQTGEPFGLVLTEAMACGTPVAALDRGAVREIVEDGITGGIFSSLDQMVDGLAAVIALDRASVRARTVARFGVEKMIDAYEEMYARLARMDPQRIDAALAPGTGL